MPMFSAEAKQSNALSSHFSSYFVNKGPSPGLFIAMIFVFLCFFGLGISLFKMVSKENVELLASVPKGKKTVMYLMEKISACK